MTVAEEKKKILAELKLTFARSCRMPERNIFSSEHSVLNLIFGEKNQSLIPETRLSIYVLESSNSRRLTYFMPPMVSTPSYAYYYCMESMYSVLSF